MVSIRCKMVVKAELQRLGLHFVTVNLGEIDVLEDITPVQRENLKMALKAFGLELMDDKRAILIDRIKAVVIELIHYGDEIPKKNFSNYLSEKLDYDYTYLSNLFSETEGTTIEQFLINHRIERVKELILYDELNLSKIANKLNYSSISHLSHQFKKVTGLTPTFFKSLKFKKRQTLDNM